jgi:putative inorganic carbon (HCO3(-)) transporter
MGFVFTVIYIVITIVSPAQFGPEWASYHVLLYLAGLTALTSLPAILTEPHLKSSIQTYLLFGFVIAIGLSQVANHWFGGAIQSWLVFLPSAAVYFFVVANVTTIRRLKIIIFATVASCLVLVVEALWGYYGGFLGDTFVLKMNVGSNDQVVGQILRLRSAGFLNDPNDFAQMLLIAVPLIFIAWRQGRVLANSLFVLAPAALLLWATYLTHSRGALIGLGILGLMASRKRLGTIASLALASVLALGLLALDFTGGRGISASEGADRLEAWATGLEMLKHSPIFGVGFGNFTNFSELTAHNSVVLCLAELGLVGATMWLALLVTTTMGLNSLIALREVEPAMRGSRQGITNPPAGPKDTEVVSDITFDAAGTASFEDQSIASRDELPTEADGFDVVRIEEQSSSANAEYETQNNSGETAPFFDSWATTTEIAAVSEVATPLEIESVYGPIVPGNCLAVIRLALIAFMTTSWFLSRAYETPVYLVLGLATAAIALEPSSTEARDCGPWMYVTAAVELLAIISVYIVVRFRH